MCDENPTFQKSTKTSRSPEQTKATNRRQPSVIPTNRTRSQGENSDAESTTSEATLISKKPAKSVSEETNKPIQSQKPKGAIVKARNKATQTSQPQTTEKHTETTHRRALESEEMAGLKEMQQSIVGLVPEFNGSNGLTRFLGAADSIYSMLKENEEKKIFTNLIKFRLTGNAYNRIANKQIDSYEAFKETLKNMYSEVWTLGELERKFIDIRQTYNETVRDFGHRVTEALESYKAGYKVKYGIEEIDKVYLQHLDDTAILSFKRGLNNTILKEKIATIRTTKLEEIIREAETMERFLQNVSPQTRNEPQIPSYGNQRSFNNFRQGIPRTITCNYCHKQGHTYDRCRARLSTQQNTEWQMNGQRQMNTYNTIPRNSYTNTRDLQQAKQQSYQPSSSMQYAQPTHQSNYTRYGQPAQGYSLPPKYCEHCKVTTGHTFAECRSKFFNRNYNTSDHPRDKPVVNGNNLADRFNQMKINPVHMQTRQTQIQNNQSTSGNAGGSSQL